VVCVCVCVCVWQCLCSAGLHASRRLWSLERLDPFAKLLHDSLVVYFIHLMVH